MDRARAGPPETCLFEPLTFEEECQVIARVTAVEPLTDAEILQLRALLCERREER